MGHQESFVDHAYNNLLSLHFLKDPKVGNIYMLS